MTTKVTGQNLITLTELMKGKGEKVTAICVAAGYKTGDKINYTDYYTELLTAQGKIKIIDDKIIPVIIAEDERYQHTIDRLLENYPAGAIEAFIELNGECYIESFESSYRGEYESGADFAQEYYEELNGDLPTWISVDWEDTWDNLRNEFSEENGYIFCNTF